LNPVRAIVRLFLRSAGAGLALAIPALILALLLNPGFPFPSRHALVLWLLFAFFYSLLWTMMTLVAVLPLRFLTRWRRREGRIRAESSGRGFRAALSLAFLYTAGAWLFNALHNRTTVASPGTVLIVTGAVLCLFIAMALAPGISHRGSRSRFRGAAAAVIILLLVLPFFRPGSAATLAPKTAPEALADSGRRVFVIGIDSASWGEVDPLLARGLLPNLERLLKSGCRGTLDTFIPTESPLIWASMATGKRPAGHGIRFFLRVDFPGVGHPLYLFPQKLFLGRMEMFKLMRFSTIDGSQMTAAAFWDVVGRDLPVGVVNWWQTYPAARVNGYMVTDHVSFVGLRHDPPWGSGLTHPPGLARRISDWEAADPVPGAEETRERFFRPEGAAIDELEDYIHWRCFEPDEKTARIVRRLLDRQPLPRLLAVYWNGLDPVGHFFMRFAHPERFGRVDSELVNRYGLVLERYYRYTDDLIGLVLEKMDDRTAVILVSDHGMEPYRGVKRLYNTWLMGGPLMTAAHRDAPPGIVVLAGAGIREGVTLDGASVLDIGPTALALLGYPPALDFDGRVLEEVLEADVRQAVAAAARPASYDALILPRSDSAAELADDDAFRQHLEDLGYIE
jgi:predicted AlkP superfamily phosphohydrolase/phosphomutase